MVDSSALAASGASSLLLSLPDAPCPPAITEFFLRFLTGPQVTQTSRQFLSSWHRSRQVMWTGNIRDRAQKWAGRRGMWTLSTAMGPLANGDDPRWLEYRATNPSRMAARTQPTQNTFDVRGDRRSNRFRTLRCRPRNATAIAYTGMQETWTWAWKIATTRR